MHASTRKEDSKGLTRLESLLVAVFGNLVTIAMPAMRRYPRRAEAALAVDLRVMRDTTLILWPYALLCSVHTISYLIPSRSLKKRA
jgi:hypothetical protein